MKNTEELMERYRKKYKYYNEDTLQKAVIDDVQLLIEILEQADINGLAKSYGLLALGELVDEQYYDYIKTFFSHKSPYVREAAFMSISKYYHKDPIKFLEVKHILQNYLELETDGVKQQIQSCLENLDFYCDIE
jgi:HEAT repeat protein